MSSSIKILKFCLIIAQLFFYDSAFLSTGREENSSPLKTCERKDFNALFLENEHDAVLQS